MWRIELASVGRSFVDSRFAEGSEACAHAAPPHNNHWIYHKVTIDLRQFSSALSYGDDGIWRSGRSEAVSYPVDGNVACLQLEEGSFWFNHRNRCIAAAIRKHPPSGPVFDVGGGNGYVSGGLVAEGFETILVEPGIEGARAARRRGLSTVVCATLSAATFRPGSLPAVGLFDVVEHIEHDSVFLREVHGALAPGGKVYLTVPAYRWLWSSEDEQAGHFRRYTLRSATQALMDSGFRIEYATYFFRWLPLPIFLLRTLPSALGLRRKADAATHTSEHASGSGTTRSVLDRALAGEVAAIKAGQTIGFGGSILLVASR